MNDKRTLITKTVASASLALALVGGIGSGTAGAQTREHILLARQVGVPAATVELRTGDSTKQIAAGGQDTAGRVNIRWEKIAVPFV